MVQIKIRQKTKECNFGGVLLHGQAVGRSDQRCNLCKVINE